MRGAIAKVKELFGDNEIIGCEIGVWKGEHAKEILENFPNLYLYLVDNGNYPYTIELRTISKNVQRFVKRVSILTADSPLASERFNNYSINFVYIDADHEYNGVIKDIYAWYPKVKLGGVLGGHDYDSGHPGVMMAVGEFIKNNNLTLFTGKSDDGYDDWWVIKNGEVIK